ncbi:O-antigen ligase family protein [Sulfitobacter sp. JL08]|uniref:O-antigen ligase family protein n=1 Tax=Sulfitobacter sp. JL08 TaxID=2070369 RepID=UPI0013B3E4D2|nr:O-antigen ligase family protein [Sulfitobacter sp. JL08]
MIEKPLKMVQGILGLLALVAVLASVLLQGGNTPIAWSLLALVLLSVLFIQMFIGQMTPVPLAVQRLVFPGLLFLGALGWAWVQAGTAFDPDYAHPFWSYVPASPPSISADPGQGRHALMRLLCYASIFLVMVWTCIDAQRAALALKGIAIFSMVISAYGLFAFATGYNFFLEDFATASLVQSTFVNRNNFATYGIFGVFANLAAVLHASTRQPNTLKAQLEGFFSGTWIYALGFLVCVGAVSLTQSRAGAIAGLFGLAVFLWAWPKGKARIWDKVMLALLVAILFFLALTSATGLTERLIATSAEEARFVIYPIVVEAIADRPLLGHGLGAFHDAFRPYVPMDVSGREWVYAHNTYLELIFGLGLPAATAFFLALILIFWRIYQGARKRRTNRVFSCFALACAATAAFHSAFDFSLQMPAVAGLFAAILGMGFAQSFTFSERKRTDAKEKRARNF